MEIHIVPPVSNEYFTQVIYHFSLFEWPSWLKSSGSISRASVFIISWYGLYGEGFTNGFAPPTPSTRNVVVRNPPFTIGVIQRLLD